MAEPVDRDHDGIVQEGHTGEHRVTLRPFADVDATRDAIFKNAVTAASKLEPVANKTHRLEITNITLDPPERFLRKRQKQAILEGGTLARRLRGKFRLIDQQTGQAVAEKETTLAHIPYLTENGTFIHNGSEYSLASQQRLRPGVYARRKSNGELEAHVNAPPGAGRAFRVGLDPATGKFTMEINQAKLPLLPVLRALGATDQDVRDAWGPALLHTNRREDDGTVLKRVHEKLAFPGSVPEGSYADGVRKELGKIPLDPIVTGRTLDQPHTAINAQSLLATTRKLLAINQGKAEPDDRDHPAFMTVHGPEDLLTEKIARVKAPLYKALWKASRLGHLNHLQPGLLTPAVNGAILESGLGQPGESVNPAMILDQIGRASRLGEGAIASADAIPEESRALQPAHLNFIDSIWTPESAKAGVDTRAASSVMKGDDGKMYAPFRDVRTGQVVYRSPDQLIDKAVAFPGELAALQQKLPGRGYNAQGQPIRAQGNRRHFVNGIRNGRLGPIAVHEVDYEPLHAEHGFSPVANMVLMKSAIKPQRASMGGRFITQALPLLDAEAPFVRAGDPDNPGKSFEEKLGEAMGALRAKKGGVVEEVAPDKIVIRHDDGTKDEHELYYHRPMNRKTGIHQTATVQKGQRVEPGHLLARSNFTDAQGVTALGKNFRVAYLPAHGYNYEDAIVLSEAAAKRFTSDHYYQHELEHGEDLTIGRDAHTAIFPGKHMRDVLSRFTDDGVIKPGTVVEHGHPLVLAAKRRERSYGSLHAGRKASFSDASLTWDHHAPGVVTDVARTKKGTLVVVRSHASAEVGDKVAGRHGDKGVIAKILPDDQMPRDKDGKPYEVLLNPLGVISRVNPAQVVEAALGKIAEKTGQPYNVEDFKPGHSHVRFARQELAKHGLTDLETIHDPLTNRDIPLVLTGNRFLMKLHHTAESKAQGRATGAYTAEGVPAKGGTSGAKRLSLGDNMALLSHGATGFLRDVAIRGQDSTRYWQQVMSGYTPPDPDVPPVYEKFFEMLKAAGINPQKQGMKTRLMALTDRDVDALAGSRALENTETVDFGNGMRPVKGGLFDPALTGGNEGDRWAAIPLHEPMPNPVFEEPIRRMLGLTGAKFRDVLAGRMPLGNHGSGPQAIKSALDAINIDRSIDLARREIDSGRASARDAAVRKLAYLKAAKDTGIHPRDWMLSRVPVLPPRFRPVAVMQGGLPMVADPNLLYKELHEANDNLKSVSGKINDVGDERLAVYDAFRGVTGLGDPIHPKNQERQVTGILKKVFGEAGPKFGMVQRKLIGATVDTVGRAVVSPDPELDLDQVGLPEEQAWESYKPFVIRRLVRQGVDRLRAAKAVTDREPLARKALETEMQERPVVLGRAPTLHRYSLVGLRPVITPGHTIRVTPLITKGMGMDFDGDTAAFHVPASDDAVRDVYEKMLPSKNLFAVSDFKAHQVPSQEYIAGLIAATTKNEGNRHVRVFATSEDAIRAMRRGELDPRDEVDIVN